MGASIGSPHPQYGFADLQTSHPPFDLFVVFGPFGLFGLFGLADSSAPP